MHVRPIREALRSRNLRCHSCASRNPETSRVCITPATSRFRKRENCTERIINGIEQRETHLSGCHLISCGYEPRLKKQSQFAGGPNTCKLMYDKGLRQNRLVWPPEKTNPIQSQFGGLWPEARNTKLENKAKVKRQNAGRNKQPGNQGAKRI